MSEGKVRDIAFRNRSSLKGHIEVAAMDAESQQET